MEKTRLQNATASLVGEYIKDSEVCMAEFLQGRSADGLTIGEAFELYMSCMQASDGDRFFRLAGTESAPVLPGALEELTA